MKNLSLFLMLVFFVNCGKEETKKTPCIGVNSFSITQSPRLLNFEVTSTNVFARYEVSFQYQGNNLDPDQAQIVEVTSNNFSLSTNYFPFLPAQILFYVRGVCSPDNKTEWVGPVSIYVNENCSLPYGVTLANRIDGLEMNWNHSQTLNAYQVQYGMTGFSIGSGAIVNTNTRLANGFAIQQGSTYDFYVRALCNGGLGWSDWSGPYSYYCSQSQNLCTIPSDVRAVRQGSSLSTIFNFSWSSNGEYVFEYEVTSSSTAPEVDVRQVTYTNFSLQVGNARYFRVRAVCRNGNRTAWAGVNL